MSYNWRWLLRLINPPWVMANAVLIAFGVPAFAVASSGVDKSGESEWTLVGGDLNNSRYSRLDQINRTNVTKVYAAWVSKKFDEGGTSRVTPVVSGGLMFVTSGRYVYALNAKTGARIWRYKTAPDHEGKWGEWASIKGTPNYRGVSAGGGMVFVGLMDGRVIALAEKSGKLVWSRQTGVDKPMVGQWASPAPTYANGVVVTGLSVGEFSMRGRFTALEANSGKIIWQKFSIPGPGEKGHETWPSFNNTWKTGGGGVWTNSPVDPDLSLAYFATGNPVPSFAGDWRPGNNLYTSSVVALDIRTGEIRWYYQLVHHDIFEADIGTPVVLYDLEVAGARRKALAVLRADGYLFQLDRQTGQPLLPVEERPVPQLESQKTSATQPYPVGGESILRSCEEWKKQRLPRGFVLGCMFTPPSSPPPSVDPPNVLAPYPSARVFPMAYSPQTGFFYAQSISYLWWARRAQDAYYLESRETWPGAEYYIDVAAIDSRSGKIAWKRSVPTTSLGGGPLVTAGGLMFHSTGDGNFEADDAASGELRWQFQTGTPGADAPPATYEIDGEQYVAVSMGPAIWAFKLGGKIHPAPNPTVQNVDHELISGAIVDTTEIETTSLGHSSTVPGNRYFIDEYTFSPNRARVHVGTQVQFINNGDLRHEIVALDGSWGTGPLSPSEQTWITFPRAGEYTYICKEHPWSYGQIIVTAEDRSRENSREGGSPVNDFAAQAKRGQEQYNRSCSKCHGENLAGHSNAPALVGSVFMAHWQNRTAAELLARIQATMPQGNPGSLSRNTYASVVAYLLQVNRVTAGMATIDVTKPDSLKRVKLRRLGDGLR